MLNWLFGKPAPPLPPPSDAVLRELREVVARHQLPAVFLAWRYLSYEYVQNASLRAAYPGTVWLHEQFLKRTRRAAESMRLRPRIW